VGRRIGRARRESARKGPRRDQPFLLRYPKAVLAVAASLLIALAIIGTGTEDRLDPSTLDLPGTESLRGNELLEQHFGDSAPFAILLQGPGPAIDRQGPELISALREDPRVTTLSPWDRGAVDRLRPSQNKALILADFHVDTRTSLNESVPHLKEVLAEEIRPPVRATQSGYASLSLAIQEDSLDAAHRGELIALPFLLLILLLVFRSPIAALIPLAFGFVTVVASRGILYWFTGWFEIDAFALVVCSMMGLALGVDYALLMVSRFREELAEGAEPVEAARLTRRHAGRTVMFAGSTLLLSMIVSLFILPGSLLPSLAGTVCMVVILSVGVATLVGPAILSLLGPNVDRWRFGATAPAGGRSRLMVLVGAVLKKPALATLLIGILLLFLAGPVIGLKTGPPSPEQLAVDSPARQDAELINREIGQGFNAPFQVVAVSSHGPITDAKNLAALDNFQRKLAKTPGVQAVIGPGRATERVEPLQALGNSVLSSEGNIGPVKQLGRLGRSLDVAAGGVGQLRDGISEASDGAGLLALGSGRAAEGAQLIANGLTRALGGSQEAIDALDRFAKGSRQLENGLNTAILGAFRLKIGLQSALPNLRANLLRRSKILRKSLNEDANEKLPQLIPPAQVAEAELKAALAQLDEMTVGKDDPKYAGTLEAVRKATAAVTGKDPVSGAPYDPKPETPEVEPYTGLPAELGALDERLLEDWEQAKQINYWLITFKNNLQDALRGAEKLEEGLRKLHGGSSRLAAGADRLARESRRLGDGITQLSGGAVRLVSGLDDLGDGAEALQEALAAGVTESAPLETGLEEASVQVLAGRHRIRKQAGQVADSSPGLFNSGYFVLSALDGTPPETRQQISETIDLERGGQAATMLVISDYSFNTEGSIALNRKLNADASELAEKADLQTGVAGAPAQLNDYSRVTRERMPWVIIAITIATFLVLMIVLRALLLAAIAVALNLLTVAVAFGVLTLLFHIPDSWPLGGHNYVDAVGATLIFGLVFGLSIDYAVFLLSRMREHYDKHGDNAAAVDFGLSRTAGVITGAAMIMMVVFIAFAGAPIATVSQLGVGLTVAVILDATVVRIVLLPALMLLLGDRVWWLPKPLARVIPKLSV
jgi:putative drug exporter of the RND superfamily